jgi:predicted ATP-binding protein involved in virulence
MRELTQKQKEVLEALKRQIDCYLSSNDYESPTIKNDFRTVVANIDGLSSIEKCKINTIDEKLFSLVSYLNF